VEAKGETRTFYNWIAVQQETENSEKLEITSRSVAGVENSKQMSGNVDVNETQKNCAAALARQQGERR
jgi:hypothetical protein